MRTWSNIQTIRQAKVFSAIKKVGYVSFGLREQRPAPLPVDPVVHDLLGLEEGCLDCHGDLAGFAPAHNPEIIGCTPCHSGNPSATTLEAAHKAAVLVKNENNA